MPTDELAAWTQDLSVARAGGVLALDRIDVQVAHGRIAALAGANGAGKSTCMAVLAGALAPSGGRAFVLGVPRHERVGLRRARELRARIGHAAQALALDPDARARDLLDLFGVLHGIPRPERRARVARLVELLALEALLGRRVARLSGGEARRVHIALALLHDAELLLLDEPTAGLDAASSAALWDELAARTRTGVAVLVATHALDEIEARAHEVVLLQRGRVVERGTPAAIVSRHARSFLVASFGPGSSAGLPQERARRAAETLARFPDARGHALEESALVVEVADARASAPRLLAHLAAHELAPDRLEIRASGLAAAFRALTGTDAGAGETASGPAADDRGRGRGHRRTRSRRGERGR